MSPGRGAMLIAAPLLAGVVLELYARLPAQLQVAPLGLPGDSRTVILLFHGRGGRDDPQLIELERRFGELAAGRSGIVVRRYVWSPHSDTRFRAAVNGATVGAALGTELAALPELESVHVVAHSAGAYLPDPLCEALKSAAARPVRVEMTFLDPIGFQGMVDAGWGARHFGACADYAEAIINTDDPVPATNAPLERAYNIDVTEAGRRVAYDGGGHRWPVRWYTSQLVAADIAPTARDHVAHPRGAVERRR